MQEITTRLPGAVAGDTKYASAGDFAGAAARRRAHGHTPRARTASRPNGRIGTPSTLAREQAAKAAEMSPAVNAKGGESPAPRPIRVNLSSRSKQRDSLAYYSQDCGLRARENFNISALRKTRLNEINRIQLTKVQ